MMATATQQMQLDLEDLYEAISGSCAAEGHTAEELRRAAEAAYVALHRNGRR